VTLSNDDGVIAEGTVAGDEEGRAVVEVTSIRRVIRRSPVLSVGLAPPKGDRLAWAVQKLAELGVDEIVPLRTDRAVRDWDPGREGRAVAKLRMVAREAATQSRQAFVSMVLDPMTVADAANVRASVVVLDPGGGGLDQLNVDEPPAAVRLLVGPEGGFTEAEVARASEHGALVISLGESVLRTETAAVVGAALLLHRFGRLG
jgi:16S rRNA (uracil1498-N3)-methyltransferase